MSKFTDRLWREIVREHGPELAQMDRLPPTPAGTCDRDCWPEPEQD